MAKDREIDAPKPPEIPSAEHEFRPSGLNGWVPSTDPQEGRFVDHDDDCKCADCGNPAE
jgi:hypothetical protein